VPESAPTTDDYNLLWASFEQSPIGIVHSELDGRWIRINRKFCDILGYEREALLQKHHRDVTYPEDLAGEVSRHQCLQAGDIDAFTYEKRCIRQDGTLVWVAMTVSMLRRLDGAPLHLIGMVEDISVRKRIEEARRHDEEWFRALIEHVSDLVMVVEPDGVVRYASPAHKSVLGYETHQIIGRNISEFAIEDEHAAQRAYVDETRRQAGIGGRVERKLRHADGSVRVVEAVSNNQIDNPAVRGIIVNARDITARLRAEARLRQSETGFRMLFSANPQPMWVVDQQTLRFLEVNDAAVAHYGWTRDEFLAMFLHDLGPLDDTRTLTAQTDLTASGSHYRGEGVHRLKDGRFIDVEINAHVLSFNEKPSILSVIHDVTEQKRDRAALHHQALHDALTGLPNRAMLQTRLEEILYVQRDTDRAALLLLDLDHFKDVNDTFGHPAGDRLLQHVATRLATCLRQNDDDLIVRLGGDEFAVLLSKADEASARVVAARITASLDQPFLVHEQEMHIGVSLGIALYPDHGDDGETILRHADIAMYVAKRSDQSIVLYTREHDLHSPDRVVLMTDLRRAIEHDELVLHYQPKVLPGTGRVVGVEALVRWLHPTHGLVRPDAFIPMAESIGLIKQLTWQVLEKALRQHSCWRAAGLTLDIAVNLSPSSLRDPRFVETVIALLLRYNVQPARLRLELTESAIMSDHVQAVAVLRRLTTHGVHISIDDFGSGYSSLLYLKQLPVDELKIDKTFVQQMSTTEADTTIVAATVDLAHNLGLHVVAEGVEDCATLDLLTTVGCDIVQGYYIAPPLHIDALNAWLSTKRGRHAS